MKTLRTPALFAALWLAGCGTTPSNTTKDAGPLVDTPMIVDAGLTAACPSGFTLNSAVNLTYKDTTFVDGCWQATIGDGPLLTVHGLPTYALGQLQFSIQFNAQDADSVACNYASNTTFPLSSTCIVIEGSNLNSSDWSILQNSPRGDAAPAGSLTVNQWPAAAGQTLSVSFSEDAAVVVRAQNGNVVAAPFTGSFTTTAN